MLVLAVKVEDFAAPQGQRCRGDGTPVRGVVRPVELEDASAQVDEDRTGMCVGRVAVPGDARVTADRETEARLGAEVDAPPDRHEQRPEPIRRQPRT